MRAKRHFFRRGSKLSGHRTIAFALIFICSLPGLGCYSIPQNSGSSSTPPSNPAALPAATVGKPYLTVIPINRERLPYLFLVNTGQLPPGLLLNAATGVISGHPTDSGQFSFTISARAEDLGSSTAGAYTIKVAPCTDCVALQISPLDSSITPGGKMQFAATVTKTSDSRVSWFASAGSITSTGLFTAPTDGIKTITVTATSMAQPSAQTSTTVSVADAALRVNTGSIPSALVGSRYQVQLAATGGQPPYTWNLSSGLLPPGLQLASSSGTIAGLTAQSGTFSLTVKVGDAAAHWAQQTFTLLVSNLGGHCGPPTYECSRSDLDIVQVPSFIPSVGNLAGANTVVVDPDFRNRVARITDFYTDPAAPLGAARTFVSSTSGSADENLWNIDSTLFMLQGNNGAAYVYSFSPSTMQASRMYVSSYASTMGLKLPHGGTWSRVNSNILYVYDGTSIIKYDFADRTKPPSPQSAFDFTTVRNCLPATFSPTWQSKGGVSAGDLVFGGAYSNSGSQGTGIYAVAYKAGSGCSLLNTETGQVSGDWGTKGAINIPDRWTIHNAKLSKDGNWLILMPQTCTSSSCSKGPYFWQVGTTNVRSCGDAGQCGGHWTEGYSHWVNNNNSPLGNEVSRAFSEMTTRNLTTNLPRAIITPFDQHQSWNNADPADSLPFMASTWSSVTPFPAPWYNEIIGVAADGGGKIWRFAHTFVTARSQDFSTLYAIGSVSQDGRFFLFSSDWMGTLGSESGSQRCTIGKDCRGDVFVVELK